MASHAQSAGWNSCCRLEAKLPAGALFPLPWERDSCSAKTDAPAFSAGSNDASLPPFLCKESCCGKQGPPVVRLRLGKQLQTCAPYARLASQGRGHVQTTRVLDRAERHPRKGGSQDRDSSDLTFTCSSSSHSPAHCRSQAPLPQPWLPLPPQSQTAAASLHSGGTRADTSPPRRLPCPTQPAPPDPGFACRNVEAVLSESNSVPQAFVRQTRMPQFPLCVFHCSLWPKQQQPWVLCTAPLEDRCPRATKTTLPLKLRKGRQS